MNIKTQHNLNQYNSLQPTNQPHQSIFPKPTRWQLHKPIPTILHGLPISPLASTHNMTPALNNYSQPIPPVIRTTKPKKALYYNTNPITTIPNHDIYRHRANYILHFIWSNPSTHLNCHYPMRKPNRTPKCRNVLPILHSSRIPTPASSTTIHSKQHRHTKLPNDSTLDPTPIKFLI